MIDLVAAVGLWLAAAWGAVVWLTAVRVDGGGRGVLPAGLWRAPDRSWDVEAVLLFAYLFLAIQSAREHPN